MTPADSLMLDAKQAILEEQHRRFQSLQEEGRLQEAMQQFQVTLGCASDLLNDSLGVLERLLVERRSAVLPHGQEPPRLPELGA
ncbi:MAG: hypothetical protein EPO61_15680 [Nitrospirae bacterium]|nr:MAG: hypothetical protein EPO61_15680 [Nitrospirota bacterium]